MIIYWCVQDLDVECVLGLKYHLEPMLHAPWYMHSSWQPHA